MTMDQETPPAPANDELPAPHYALMSGDRQIAVATPHPNGKVYFWPHTAAQVDSVLLIEMALRYDILPDGQTMAVAPGQWVEVNIEPEVDGSWL